MAIRPLPSRRWISVGFLWLPRAIERQAFGKLLDRPSLTGSTRRDMKILSNSATDIVGKLFAPVARTFSNIGRILQLALEADDGSQTLYVTPNGTGGWNVNRGLAGGLPATLPAAMAAFQSTLPAGNSKAYSWACAEVGDDPTSAAAFDDLTEASGAKVRSFESFLLGMLAGTYDAETAHDAADIEAFLVDQANGRVYITTDETDTAWTTFATESTSILTAGESADTWE